VEEAAGDSSRLVGEGILAGEEERSPRRKPVVDEVSATALDEDEEDAKGGRMREIHSFHSSAGGMRCVRTWGGCCG
jgi:hypothetical protein